MSGGNRRARAVFAGVLSVAGVLAATVWGGDLTGAGARTTSPRWQHVVIVMEENHDYDHIIGSPNAPYFNWLLTQGISFRNMHGERHPSQPNYVAFLSGSTQGLTDDSCPHQFRAANLASQLLQSRRSFAGYAEGLPAAGWYGCVRYPYARKHVPWADFSTVPGSTIKTLSSFPTDYTKLPTVSFVIPNLVDDMHDGTVAQGDAWLKKHLGSYVTWARAHHSLLIVTWDEDEGTAANQIATAAVGDGVTHQRWWSRADHYTLLAVLEKAFRLPLLGGAAHATNLPPLS